MSLDQRPKWYYAKVFYLAVQTVCPCWTMAEGCTLLVALQRENTRNKPTCKQDKYTNSICPTQSAGTKAQVSSPQSPLLETCQAKSSWGTGGMTAATHNHLKVNIGCRTELKWTRKNRTPSSDILAGSCCVSLDMIVLSCLSADHKIYLWILWSALKIQQIRFVRRPDLHSVWMFDLYVIWFPYYYILE